MASTDGLQEIPVHVPCFSVNVSRTWTVWCLHAMSGKLEERPLVVGSSFQDVSGA